MPDSHFAQLIKTHAQAKVIYKNLKKLHRVCTDFAGGRFQSYIDKHNRYEEKNVKNSENRIEYEPFAEIDIPFNEAFNFSLTKEIEHFPELLILCHNYTEIQKIREETDPLWYQTVDEEGETVILPPNELPADFVYEQNVNHELRGVEVEYCLDNYNDFYRQAMGILSNYHTADVGELLHRFMEGDWIPPSDNLGYAKAQDCATKLLSLFSSSH